jgi:hypothetical protein
MLVKIQGKRVDVLDKNCASRSCFALFADKGHFVPGRGYTSYHKEVKWCCGTRHLHGCPTSGVCPHCQTCLVEGQKGKCPWCHKEIPDPAAALQKEDEKVQTGKTAPK